MPDVFRNGAGGSRDLPIAPYGFSELCLICELALLGGPASGQARLSQMRSLYLCRIAHHSDC